MTAKIRPVRVTHGDVDAAHDLRIDFFKARAIARFRNQFACGKKTIGSHLKEPSGIFRGSYYFSRFF